MPVHIEGDLASNIVYVDQDYLEKLNRIVILWASGIVGSINSSRPGHYVRIDLDDNCCFEMEPNSFVNHLNVNLPVGSRARIGENTFAVSKAKLFSHEAAEILIGRNCLLGDELECLTSDMHSFLDLESQFRINSAGNIIVDDNVCVGAQMFCLKGSKIVTGCVVGISSTVLGESSPNCVLLGFPARVVKTGVTLHRDLIPMGTRDE